MFWRLPASETLGELLERCCADGTDNHSYIDKGKYWRGLFSNAGKYFVPPGTDILAGVSNLRLPQSSPSRFQGICSGTQY